MTLRPPSLLQIADVPEILRILSQFYHEEYPFPLGGAWTSLDLEKELEAGCGLGIFAEKYKLIAFILFRKTGDALDISILATDKEFSRQGHMSQLFDFLKITWAKGKEIWIEVHEKNIAAQNFYRKQGFTREGSRPRYYRDGAAAHLYTLR